MRVLRLVPLRLALAAAGSGLAAGEDAATEAPRILYSSDWSGIYQIYAVDPSGRRAPGQLTSGRAPACIPANPCGFVAPTPSPDGRRLLFWDYVLQGERRHRLFVARAEGTGRRRLATIEGFQVGAA